MKALSFNYVAVPQNTDSEKFIIFYSNLHCYDSVVVDAKSFDDACEIARMFSCVHSVIILGVFSQSSYIKLHPYE